MAIDTELYNKTAKRRHVGTVALKMSLALDSIVNCLEALQRGDAPQDGDIAKLKRMAKELEDTFDDLAGWHDEQD